ncbi:MAG: potassium channel protein [Desulfobacteraceae bacterium]|jgi:voltage-gated potassium channel
MKKRLFFVAIAVLVIILGGSSGYYLILNGKYSFFDCLYMTIISLTTVGYGEVVEVSGNVKSQTFTMILITFGASVLLYGISTLTALLIEGELSGLLRKRKMEKQIKHLKDHFIICGGGDTGVALVSEILKFKMQVVLIEQDDSIIQKYKDDGGKFYVPGDATDDMNLIAAGVDKAAGVFVCLPSDKDNLYITMTARMINKKVRIISRMGNEKIRSKLFKAGADRVVSPNSIGALRMASEMIRPTATDFLDKMLRSNQGTLRIHQISLSPSSAKIGKTIANSGIKDKFNILVLGIKKDGIITFNPPPNQIMEAGMALIVMGEVDQIVSAQKSF